MRHAAEVRSTTVVAPLVVRDARGQRTAEFRTLRREMGMPS